MTGKARWHRETRVCASIQLEPGLLGAIRDHLRRHELEGAEADALVCFETLSQRKGRPSLMERMSGAGYRTLRRAAIVTPTRLVWAQSTDETDHFAASELLAKLEITDYESSEAFALLPDHGVEVRGVPAGQGQVGTLFFGLGEGPDADKARHVLKAAAKAAHGEAPPVPVDPQPLT